MDWIDHGRHGLRDRRSTARTFYLPELIDFVDCNMLPQLMQTTVWPAQLAQQ
jgi:hypothetical protein